MLDTQSPFNLAQRIEVRGAKEHSWWAVVSETIDLLEAVGDFCFEVETVTKTPARSVAQLRLSVEDLRTSLSHPCDDIIVVIVGEWTEHEWETFDINRSAFERPGAIILWLLIDQLKYLPSSAPNIRSYIGGSIYILGADGGEMTAVEIQNRLAQFRAAFEMSDQEFIESVRSGSVGTDPRLIEWLILLGRGDLIR